MDDKAKLAKLQEESEGIGYANELFLNRDEHSSAATEQYRLRLERLEQVRKDMKELARAIAVTN